MSLYVKVSDGTPVKFPYSAADLILDNPSVSFPSGPLPDELLVEWNVLPVIRTNKPEYDLATQRVEWALPQFSEGSWVESWSIIQLTETEITQQYETTANIARLERNRLLLESDWTQLADSPVDSQVWAVYRQALRDVPNTTGFPYQIEWPVPPQ